MNSNQANMEGIPGPSGEGKLEFCSVCQGMRINLAHHMLSHSKEEIISAFMKTPTPLRTGINNQLFQASNSTLINDGLMQNNPSSNSSNTALVIPQQNSSNLQFRSNINFESSPNYQQLSNCNLPQSSNTASNGRDSVAVLQKNTLHTSVSSYQNIYNGNFNNQISNNVFQQQTNQSVLNPQFFQSSALNTGVVNQAFLKTGAASLGGMNPQQIPYLVVPGNAIQIVHPGQPVQGVQVVNNATNHPNQGITVNQQFPQQFKSLQLPPNTMLNSGTSGSTKVVILKNGNLNSVVPQITTGNVPIASYYVNPQIQTPRQAGISNNSTGNENTHDNLCLVNNNAENCRENSSTLLSTEKNIVGNKAMLVPSNLAAASTSNKMYPEQPPSYQTAIRNSSLHATSKNNNLPSSNETKAETSQTTVHIGNKITISVPKDVADKKERLQQIINEELVRGIILNDSLVNEDRDQLTDNNNSDNTIQGSSKINDRKNIVDDLFSRSDESFGSLKVEDLAMEVDPSASAIQLQKDKKNSTVEANAREVPVSDVTTPFYCVPGTSGLQQKSFNSSAEFSHDFGPLNNKTEGETLVCKSESKPIIFEDSEDALNTTRENNQEFPTTFTDLIQKETTHRKMNRSTEFFSSGTSSFKVMEIEESEMADKSFLPLQVKSDDLCLQEEPELFSPSVASESSESSCDVAKSTESSCDVAKSRQSNRHDEDLSLRAAETLADSDSEHGAVIPHHRHQSVITETDRQEFFSTDANMFLDRPPESGNLLHIQMEGPDSLAASEVLMANLSDESRTSAASSSWTYLKHSKQYSSKGNTISSQEQGSNCDPIDLRHHAPSTSSRDTTDVKDVYCVDGLKPTFINSSQPNNNGGSVSYDTASSVASCSSSAPLVIHSTSCHQSVPDDEPEPSSSHQQQQRLKSPSSAGEGGVVLNLDSCTVLPQTLNFSNLFSPNPSNEQFGGSTNAEDSNGIYLATSELMRNISSYLSPNRKEIECDEQRPISPSFNPFTPVSTHDFGLVYDDNAIMASLSPRKSPLRLSPKKTHNSESLMASPQPSTSGIKSYLLSEQDYEFDYDSDCYADSDSEVYNQIKSTFPLEQWKCHLCNKMFKSLKEKLLHAGQHSPNGCLSLPPPTVEVDEAMSSTRHSLKDIKVGIIFSSDELKKEFVGDLKGTAEIKEAQERVQEDEITSAASLEMTDFKCPDCSVELKSSEELLTHRRRALQSKYICPICHSQFAKRSAKLLHIKLFHNEPEFTCPFCFLKYKSMYTFTRHQLQHLGIVFFECNTCGHKFNRKFEYLQHMTLHSGEKVHKCVTCSKSFANENYLRRHLFTHIGGQEVICELCQKVFKNTRTLLKHKRRIHNINAETKIVRDYICSHANCGMVYKSAKKLAWHKETHNRWPKRCQFCPEKFVHKSNLIKHIRTNHNAQYLKDLEGNDECPVCKKVLLKTSLAQHMRIHSDARPFKCHLCSRGFRVKCNLDAHMFVHTGKRDRPFKCSMCVRSYRREKDLDSHMRSHKNIRPFTCNECGKSFIHKNNLMVHMRQHQGDKQYKCKHCDKAFYRKYNLQNHERVHTGDTPYTCPICNKKFTQKSNYNVHRKSFHIDRHAVHEEL